MENGCCWRPVPEEEAECNAAYCQVRPKLAVGARRVCGVGSGAMIDLETPRSLLQVLVTRYLLPA